MTAKEYPFVMYPKGQRWPWYPKFTGSVEYDDDIGWGDGPSMSMTACGPVIKGRVGIRAWFKHLIHRRQS